MLSSQIWYGRPMIQEDWNGVPYSWRCHSQKARLPPCYCSFCACVRKKMTRFEICEVRARIANLVLIPDIMRVWIGYAFYMTRELS
jgi:hypothetical protein